MALSESMTLDDSNCIVYFEPEMQIMSCKKESGMKVVCIEHVVDKMRMFED